MPKRKTKNKYLRFFTLTIISILILSSSVLSINKSNKSDTTNSNNTNGQYDWKYYEEDINSTAAFVIDSNSSLVLYEKNPDQKLYPASLTKVMTAIVVLDYVKGDYEKTVTFSYNSVTKDLDKNSATIGASAGDQLTVKDCLYSLLLPSANDVANALAEFVAGNIDDFALLMNEKAKELGLTNTNFVNPSGLHDDRQVSTARDMAKIMQCAIQYSFFLEISSSVSYRHAPIRRYKDPNNSNNQVLNTNSIMVRGSKYFYEYATAGKTGHTSLAGYNLVCSAKKDNMELICVTLKAKSEKDRFEDAKNLFNFYFKNYKSLTIKDADPRFANSDGTFSINDVKLVESLSITCDEKYHITLPINCNYEDVVSTLSYEIDDPYNQYAIGNIVYYLGDVLVGRCTVEGKIPDSDTIYVGLLDVNSSNNPSNSSSIDNASKLDNSNLSQNFDNNQKNSRLIYRNSYGNLIISKTLITAIIVVLLSIIFIGIIYIIYNFIYSNINFPLTKFIFKFKRTMKRHR